MRGDGSSHVYGGEGWLTFVLLVAERERGGGGSREESGTSAAVLLFGRMVALPVRRIVHAFRIVCVVFHVSITHTLTRCMLMGEKLPCVN